MKKANTNTTFVLLLALTSLSLAGISESNAVTGKEGTKKSLSFGLKNLKNEIFSKKKITLKIEKESPLVDMDEDRTGKESLKENVMLYRDREFIFYNKIWYRIFGSIFIVKQYRVLEGQESNNDCEKRTVIVNCKTSYDFEDSKTNSNHCETITVLEEELHQKVPNLENGTQMVIPTNHATHKGVSCAFISNFQIENGLTRVLFCSNIKNPKEFLIHRFNSSKDIQKPLIAKDGKLVLFLKNWFPKGQNAPNDKHLFSMYKIDFPTKDMLGTTPLDYKSTLSKEGQENLEDLKRAFSTVKFHGIGIPLPKNLENIDLLDANYYEYPTYQKDTLQLIIKAEKKNNKNPKEISKNIFSLDFLEKDKKSIQLQNQLTSYSYKEGVSESIRNILNLRRLNRKGIKSKIDNFPKNSDRCNEEQLRSKKLHRHIKDVTPEHLTLYKILQNNFYEKEEGQIFTKIVVCKLDKKENKFVFGLQLLQQNRQFIDAKEIQKPDGNIGLKMVVEDYVKDIYESYVSGPKIKEIFIEPLTIQQHIE